MISAPIRPWSVVFGAAVLLMGCNTLPTSDSSTTSSSAGSTTSSSDTKTVKETPPPPKVTKEREPKEREPKEGDVVGKPAPHSKFNQIKMGMGMKQVTDLIGQPTDQGAYVTGKAWIPFYYGRDSYRHELLYKGYGRLVFSGGAFGNLSSGRLSRIIHNAEETGYR